MKICKDGRIWGQINSYHNPEYKKKQREAQLGPKHWRWKGGKSYKRKYKTQKDYLYSKENLEKLETLGSRDKKGKNNPMSGKHHSDKARTIMSEKKRNIFLGSGNPNWRGGISFLPHTPDFNKRLKEEMRERDGHKCQGCFKHQSELRTRSNKNYKLIVHHIDFDKKNNSFNNLISLCRECHLRTNYNREKWIEQFKNKMEMGGGFVRWNSKQ